MSGARASPDLQVLACQIAVPPTVSPGERDAHLKNLGAKVSRELSNRRADLVALPELSSIDYSRRAFDQLEALSESLDGPSFKVWRAIAREHATHIAYSFPRRAERGFRISLAVVAPSGDLLGYYDKLHLADYGASMEKEYFQKGEHLFVFEVNGLRIAPIICYDIRIPELSRTLVVEHGVNMIVHAGAYYRDRSFYSWHQFAVSRAIENQMFFLSLNRAGDDYGHSIFCRPWADQDREPVVFAEHEEQFRHLTVECTEIKSARRRYSFLKDRLESYNLPVIGRPAVAPAK